MTILDDLMSILNFDTVVKDIRQGVFHTGVLTRNCGLAATLPRDALPETSVRVAEVYERALAYLESNSHAT